MSEPTGIKTCTCGAMLHIYPEMTEAAYPCSICGADIVLRPAPAAPAGGDTP